MMSIFRKMFGSKSCPHIVQLNDFENLQVYYIQKVRIEIKLGVCWSRS